MINGKLNTNVTKWLYLIYTAKLYMLKTFKRERKYRCINHSFLKGRNQRIYNVYTEPQKITDIWENHAIESSACSNYFSALGKLNFAAPFLITILFTITVYTPCLTLWSFGIIRWLVKNKRIKLKKGAWWLMSDDKTVLQVLSVWKLRHLIIINFHSIFLNWEKLMQKRNSNLTRLRTI